VGRNARFVKVRRYWWEFWRTPAEPARGPARVKLPRRLVVETYALCRQAERSVDKVLNYQWPEFTCYYQGNRVAAVKRVVEQLRQLASDGACDPSPGREELTRDSRRPGLVQFLFGKWLSAGKKSGVSLPRDRLHCRRAAGVSAAD